MLRFIFVTLVFIFSHSLVFASQCKIGIVVPMQHNAMQEIVSGFKAEITNRPALKDCQLKVRNAHGDLSIQRALILSMLNDGVDYILPIGTQTTQMALSMSQKFNSKIVGLASMNFDDKLLESRGASIILDEIPIQSTISFMLSALPNIKGVNLIYSASDKITPEVNAFLKLPLDVKVTRHKLMVQSLIDLQMLSRNLTGEGAILILKDHLVVSGSAMLSQIAAKQDRVFVASDEGSVEEGACYALGVKESGIGIKGADVVDQIVLGKEKSNIHYIKDLSVFMNNKACKLQGASTENIEKAAKSSGYSLVTIG